MEKKGKEGTTLIVMDVRDFESEPALTRVSDEEREKALRFRQEEDRKLFLAGRLLIRRFISNKPLSFLPNKKPYIEGASPFSLSHSYPYVCLLFSSSSVGIDIEMKARLSSSPLEKFFSEEDMQRVSDLGYLWCLKEAVFKCSGEGNFYPKEPFEEIGEDVVRMKGKDYFVQRISHSEAMIVAALSNEEEVEIHFLKGTEL